MENLDTLLDAISFVESSDNPKAVNKRTGARGAYQFLPIAWKDVQQNYKDLSQYDYEQAFDPKVSRQFAKALLELNTKRLGKDASIENLLSSYNWGIGNTRKGGWKSAPKETQDYITKVTDFMNKNNKAKNYTSTMSEQDLDDLENIEFNKLKKMGR